MSKKKTPYRKRSAGAFIRNVIGVAITGLVAGLAGIVVGASSVKGLDGIAGALAGLIIGYPVGVIIGTIWINKVRHYYGSLLFASIGSILGTLLAISLEEPLNLELDPILLFGIFFLSVPLLCIIGFYLKKQPVEAQPEANS